MAKLFFFIGGLAGIAVISASKEDREAMRARLRPFNKYAWGLAIGLVSLWFMVDHLAA